MSSQIISTPTEAAPAPVSTPSQEFNAAYDSLNSIMCTLQGLKPLARLELARELGLSCSLPVGKTGIGRPLPALWLATHSALIGATVEQIRTFAMAANKAAKEAGLGVPFTLKSRGMGGNGASTWKLNAPKMIELAD